jgi:hypothetical protein
MFLNVLFVQYLPISSFDASTPTMKEISRERRNGYVVFENFPEEYCKKGLGTGGVTLLPSPLTYFSKLIRGYH